MASFWERKFEALDNCGSRDEARALFAPIFASEPPATIPVSLLLALRCETEAEAAALCAKRKFEAADPHDAAVVPGLTALHVCAALCAHDDVLRYIMGTCRARVSPPTGPDGATPLILAARRGHIPVMKLLFSFGASPNESDAHGMTALHHTARGGKLAAARLLVSEWEAVPDPGDTAGRTPLMLAAMHDHVPVLRFLLAAGAKPNKVDACGRSSLFYANNTEATEALRMLVHSAGSPVVAKESRVSPAHKPAGHRSGPSKSKAKNQRALERGSSSSPSSISTADSDDGDGDGGSPASSVASGHSSTPSKHGIRHSSTGTSPLVPGSAVTPPTRAKK
jgi:hypothetical protein